MGITESTVTIVKCAANIPYAQTHPTRNDTNDRTLFAGSSPYFNGFVVNNEMESSTGWNRIVYAVGFIAA